MRERRVTERPPYHSQNGLPRVSGTHTPVLSLDLRDRWANAIVNRMVTEALNLAGEWVGHYTGHFDEFVRIVQEGSKIEAWKITGDDYVPAGALTWRADLQTGRGEGQIAEREFRNPRLIPGKLTVLDPERIIFEWEGCGAVEYRRDD